MLKLVKLCMAALLVVSCSKEPEPKPTTPLVIKTSNGDARFSVEVANTPDELQQGLMHRSTLAFNSGMIFNIYPVRPTAMWMKNTKIPLDMIFVAPDGTVSMIKENAQPMSEDLIISRDPVRAVIELNAGQIRRNQIKIGDKVTHMLLNGILDIKTANEPAAAPKAPVAEKNIPVPELQIDNKPAGKVAEDQPAMKDPLPPVQENKSPEIGDIINAQEAEKSAAQTNEPKLPVPAPMM